MDHRPTREAKTIELLKENAEENLYNSEQRHKPLKKLRY